MAELTRNRTFEELDVEIFDTVDYDLLDDNGNFETFCMSMDFNPLLEWDANGNPIENKAAEKSGRKRKLGTLMVQDPATIAKCASPTASVVSDLSANSSVVTEKVEEPKKVQPKRLSDSRTAGLSDDDMRTKYAEIFCKIFNDFDRDTFNDLVHNYCDTNDLTVIYEMVGHNPYGGPAYIEVRGVDAVASFWESCLATIPDALFVIHATKYKVLPNEFTSIVCSFTFRGTKVYRMPGIEQYDEKVVVSMMEGLSVSGRAGSPAVSTMTAAVPAGDGDNSPLRADTVASMEIERSKLVNTAMSVVGTLTFYVNASKKIYRISFVHSLKTADPPNAKGRGK